MPKPATHFLRRIWFRQLRDVPWKISRAETAKLIAVLSETRASLLHIYFGHIAVHLLPLIEQWPRPSVVSFHGADVGVDLEKPAYRAAAMQMLEAVRLVLVRSESLRDALVRLGCPAGKIRLQRTGIPLHELPFQPRSWPTDGAWKFLQACRLISKKGLAHERARVRHFCRANTRARSSRLPAMGPLLDELQRMTRDLGIADRVTFTGFISQAELRELFYASHIFLHPSETAADGNQEGVPNSMLEAMATGLPVFATTHGGIPEAIENGVSGVLVPERDADALAAALLEHARNAESLTSLGRRGAEAVAAKFEQKAQVEQLQRCYFEAIAAG